MVGPHRGKGNWYVGGRMAHLFKRLLLWYTIAVLRWERRMRRPVYHWPGAQSTKLEVP